MARYNTSFVSCLLALVLILSPLSVFAENFEIDPGPKSQVEPGVIVADLVLVRPLSLVATIAGSAVFVVALPFSALGGNTGETWESLVVSPASYTFTRPLGRFEEYQRGPELGL